MAQLQKAYDELKTRFDLIEKSSGSDVLKTLNRIPGLEESLRRYEKENRTLLAEIAALKKKMPRSNSQKTAAPEMADQEKIRKAKDQEAITVNTAVRLREKRRREFNA